MRDEDRVVVRRVIPARPNRVFAAWLDPAMLRRFMCPAPGVQLGQVTVDPREGGAFEIVMIVGDRELPHRGIYEIIQPSTRLAFTWESGNAPPGSRVAIDFSSTAAGETEVVLLHENLGSESARQDHLGGWTHILEALATLDPKEDPHG